MLPSTVKGCRGAWAASQNGFGRAGGEGAVAAVEEESQGMERDIARWVGALAVEVVCGLWVRLEAEEGRGDLTLVEDSAVHSSVVRSLGRIVEEADRLRAWSVEDCE